jgi:mannose-6-phosphate isomerase-like protein (cupin superfamily)
MMEGSAPDVFTKVRSWVREVKGVYGMKDLRDKLYEQPRVIDLRSRKYTGGPQMWNKDIMQPDDGIMQSIESHIEYLAPGGHTQKHGHQNSAVFYILDGEGYEIHDGKKYPWKAGDAAIVHNGCIHQHFNSSKTKPCKMLVVKAKPTYIFFNLLWQKNVTMPPEKPAEGADYIPPKDSEL